METSYRSLACPKCMETKGSSYTYANVESTSYYTDVEKTRMLTKHIDYSYVIKCKCKDCGHEYDIKYKNKIRITDDKEGMTNQLGDLSEIVNYESEFTRDFKLISIKTTPYDDYINNENGELTYLLLVQDDDPIKITKESAEEIYKECLELYNREYEKIVEEPIVPSYARMLGHNTYSGRHR